MKMAFGSKLSCERESHTVSTNKKKNSILSYYRHMINNMKELTKVKSTISDTIIKIIELKKPM